MSKIEQLVIEKISQRASEGKKKYKTTMERQDLTELQWLVHAQEEAMDLAVYLEKLIQLKENQNFKNAFNKRMQKIKSEK